jgi:hypothetical protein
MAGQIYVEKLEPLHARYKYPLVFIHGNGQTGTVSLQVPKFEDHLPSNH